MVAVLGISNGIREGKNWTKPALRYGQTIE